MTLKTIIKNELFKRGLLLERSQDSEALRVFLERFRTHYVSVDLIRVGGDGDGGYLIPDILNDVTCCFSPGVAETATFEADISRSHGITCFMVDASVDSAPFDDPNFVFDKKFLGNVDSGERITLKSWIDSKVDSNTKNMLLQMDIEHAEYDVLTIESIETLKRFSCMVIEFHSVEQIFNSHVFRMFSVIFEKLYQAFSICHVHPNNNCGIVSLYGIDVPRVFEVTFLRNDYVDRMRNNNTVSLPHALDRKNVQSYEDIQMPTIWWKT